MQSFAGTSYAKYSNQQSPRFGGQGVLKFSPDFIPKTLSRLLPPVEEIEKLSKEELLKLVQTKDRLISLIKNDPSRFFMPNTGGQREFCECQDPSIRIFAYLAGNKSGKSTAGAIKFCERLLGRPLWGRESRNFSFPTPARGCVFAEDFDSHKEITFPTLSTWLPKGVIGRVIRNPSGQVTEMQLSNGSLIHFRTYDQGADKHEGKDWDIVWMDEPPPRNTYTAVFRGLVSTNGIMLITATLLKEAWLLDEMEHRYVKWFTGSIHDNVFLNEQAKLDFLNSLTDDERQVRESGKPACLTGLIYKEFHDGPPFVIEDQEFQDSFPIVMAVDPHERRPLYVEYAYLNPQSEIIWFEYCFPKGSLTDIFNQLEEIDTKHGRKPAICIMDPNRGAARQIDKRSWQLEFEDHGYMVLLGMDKIDVGHSYMHEYLRGDSPIMKWTKACRGKGGPIWQMLRYSWEDWAYGKIERSPKEKPKDSNKDFPDLHRYTAAAELDFDALSKGYKILDRIPKGYRESSDGTIRTYY